MPEAPASLINHADALVQALTWAVMVESGAIIALFLGGAKALKWLLERCDGRTDQAWQKVGELTDAVNQANELEAQRQSRYRE